MARSAPHRTGIGEARTGGTETRGPEEVLVAIRRDYARAIRSPPSPRPLPCNEHRLEALDVQLVAKLHRLLAQSTGVSSYAGQLLDAAPVTRPRGLGTTSFVNDALGPQLLCL